MEWLNGFKVRWFHGFIVSWIECWYCLNRVNINWFSIKNGYLCLVVCKTGDLLRKW